MLNLDNDFSNRFFQRKKIESDVVVVGAGPAGICAAIASARMGAKTVLVTDRPVLGGSASSEIRVTPSGADAPHWNRYAKEGGIMEEISLRLADKASKSGKWRWLYYDEIYFSLVAAEKNLELFLNTTIYKCNSLKPGIIESVEGIQLRSEKIIEFTGKQFVDASGDGVVGFLSGADYRVGRESKSEFNETYAPEKADRCTMGATLLFSSVDRGHPVPYTPPEWALDVSELPTLLDPEKQLCRQIYHSPDGSFYGLWWAEYGGILDSIHDDDKVVWHTRRLVYGIWDYVKNSGKFSGVENQEIDWVGYLPGKRESRRLIGPLIPTANDFLKQTVFEDAIGFAGWPIDIHPPKGYLDPLPACTHDHLPGITDIPYRCLYSRNVDNLLFAGRNISVSHEGLGTLRVIATTAVMGQAAGAAAAYCISNNLKPNDIYKNHIPELQKILLRNDQGITGRQLIEKDDLSRTAKATASSVGKAEITDGKQWFSLTERIGLSIPVKSGKINIVAFEFKAFRDTEINLKVFACDKPQNYRFEKKVAEKTIKVSGQKWVKIKLDAAPQGGKKLFFIFEKNSAAAIRISNTRLTGIFGFKNIENGDIISSTKFDAVRFTPCFKTEPVQNLYAPENVINGHIRPYGLPHLWMSGKMIPGKETWIKLDFKNRQKIGRIELVFNSDLNTHRHSLGKMYPELIKDYEIRIMKAKKEISLFGVQGNIMRLRKHFFKPIAAEGVKLVVHGTWGSPFAEVFDFRAYRE